MKRLNKQLHIQIRWIVMIFLLLPVGGVSASGEGQVSSDGYAISTLQQAYEHWRQGNSSPIPFLFVDVRTPGEYAAGHVPGAVNIPVNHLAQQLSAIPRNKQVYVYCEAGGRAARAGKLLAEHGFTNIEVVPPSMRGWRQAGHPIKQGEK